MRPEPTKTIGVLAKVFVDWSGGIDFLSYIIRGLIGIEGARIVVFVPSDHRPVPFRIESKRDLIGQLFRGALRRRTPVAKSTEPDLAEAAERLRRLGDVEVVIFGNSLPGLLQALRRVRPDVVLPSTASLGAGFPVPWVGYIWDLQHRAFPEFFSEDDRKGRDVAFAQTLAEARAVLVNSAFVAAEVHKTYPQGRAKLFSLPFAPSPEEEWLELQPWPPLQEKYELPEKFFIVSNQFWLHKSHLTAVEALAEVGDREIHLVCTGKLEEPRDPGYIGRIRDRIRELGLDSRVHLLGYLPKSDQIQIMRRSLAVIQPTLYEGGPGGGAAYNAVALGLPLIVSDIPINQEIREEGVSFFRAGSSEDLAVKMGEVSALPSVEPTREALVEQGQRRLRLLSAALSELVEFAAEGREA